MARRWTRRPGRNLVPLGRATPAAASTAVQSYTTSAGQPMLAEWKAPEAIKLAYLSNVYVYACARAIAQDVASQPFRMGADPARRQSFNLNHPLARMLGPAPGGPAPGISARMFWEWTVVQRLITGRWAWERINDPLLGVASLWPLPASHLLAVPSKKPQQWWDGFVFGEGNKRRPLGVDQVVYGWKPSQDDWRQPESALQAARLDVSIAVMQDRYDYHFLKNDARPAALIVHERFDDPAQQVKFRRQFLAEHRGPDNAGKPLFVNTREGGPTPDKSVYVEKLGFSQVDAEFINRYASKIRSIMIAFGVPLTRLMDASTRTFNNASEETRGYWQVTVKEVANELSEAVNMQLAHIWGSDVGWFDFSDVDRQLAVPRFDPAVGVSLMQSGVVLLDEVREELGLRPRDALSAAELAELEGNAAKAHAAALASGGPPAAPATKAAPVQIVNLVGSDRAGSPPEPLELPVPTKTPYERRREQYRIVDHHVKSLESQWRRRVQRLFDAQQRAVLERLAGKRGRQSVREPLPNLDHVFNVPYWEGETEAMARDLYESVLALAGSAAAADIGVDFDLKAPYAKDFIDKRANKLAGQITETTYQGIKDALQTAVDEGEGIPEMSGRIRDLFDQTYAHRSETVARTEVISSYNGSTFQVANEYGDLVDGLMWISTFDARTRASHSGADGDVALPGDTFSIGEAELLYPGDPDGPPEETVNCRCTTAIIPAGDAKSRSSQIALSSVLEAAVHVARGADPKAAMLALTAG